MAQSFARFQKRLQAIPKRARAAIQPALGQSADEMVAAMRNLAPVDTGALKDSIVATPAGGRTPAYSQPGGSMTVPENAVVITAGNEDVRYPHLVEYGTADAAAQAFFWPAFRSNRKRATSRIKRAIGRAVKAEWSK